MILEYEKADVTYDQLAQRLEKYGFGEPKASIANKLARATSNHKRAFSLCEPGGYPSQSHSVGGDLAPTMLFDFAALADLAVATSRHFATAARTGQNDPFLSSVAAPGTAESYTKQKKARGLETALQSARIGGRQ